MWLVYALLAAVMFGFRGILYQRSSQRPIDRNLLLFGVYLSGAVITLLLALATGAGWSAANLVGMLMGTFSFVSNASMYKGFAVGRASLMAILTGMTPALVVLGGFALYGETLNAGQTVSFLVILGGLIVLRYSSDLSFTQLKGALWGVVAMVTFGITDLSSKGAMLLEADLFLTLFMMFITGSAWFYVFWRAGLRKPIFLGAALETAAAGEGGWSKLRTLLWGMIVGLTNVSGMLLIMMAFRIGITGLVSAIVAMNALMIIGYARVFLKEKFTPREIVGVAMTFAGIALLRLLGG